MDNGPKLRSTALTEWCEDKGIGLRYNQPGSPSQNVSIERFNRTCRQKVLDAYLSSDLEQVRPITKEWTTDYNEEHPYGQMKATTRSEL